VITRGGSPNGSRRVARRAAASPGWFLASSGQVGLHARPGLSPPIKRKNQERRTVEEKQKFVNTCPTKVYGFNPNNNSVNIVASQNCVFCDECVKYAEETLENPGLVKIRHSRDRFVMTVETTGSLKPAEVVAMAFKIIQQKISELKRHVEEIKNDV